MKNVYRVTRPAWSLIDRSETKVILSISVLFALYEALAALLSGTILHATVQATILRRSVWSVAEVALLTFGCLILIRYYKRLSVGCYPTTFLYCFSMPEASNPRGKSQVVGYCHVKPIIDSGEIEVLGASFFWENGQINGETRVGFTSSRVWGSKEKEETTCHIRFSLNPVDFSKRFYRHGLLQFRLDETTRVGNGQFSDAYAGYLRSTHQETEIQDVGVRSKGYAEFLCKGALHEDEVLSKLQKRGDNLLATLDAMLSANPRPTLWDEQSDLQPQLQNCWGHRIPSPQSIVLNLQLRPYINGLLNKMLSLCGLEEAAIDRFKAHAIHKATVDRDDTRFEYETDLKAALIGLVKQNRLNATLYKRAEIIKTQIEPHLIGDSLLDIGCGNGMIASLVKDHFKRIQLLDVVEYLPPGYRLPFAVYRDGERLPIKGRFDTVLLLTVLHHSSNPRELLKLAWGATEKRLIIIESVVGIHDAEPGVTYELLNSSDDDQIAYAGFIDWFYNRVLHTDVPVPYNFTTPDNWVSLFVQNKMKLAHTVHLGQDIDIGPEYHILFVLEKSPEHLTVADKG